MVGQDRQRGVEQLTGSNDRGWVSLREGLEGTVMAGRELGKGTWQRKTKQRPRLLWNFWRPLGPYLWDILRAMAFVVCDMENH